MADHFQALVGQIKFEIAEISEQQKQFKVFALSINFFLSFNGCFLCKLELSSILDIEYRHMSKHLPGAAILYSLTFC